MKTLVSYPKLSWMRDSSSLGEMVPFSKLSWFHQVITLALAAVACAKPQLLGPETQLLLGAEAQLPALGLGQVQVRSQSPQAIYYHVQTYDNAIQPVAVQPAFVYQNQPQQYQYVPLAYNQYYYNQAAAIRTPLSKADAVPVCSPLHGQNDENRNQSKLQQ